MCAGVISNRINGAVLPVQRESKAMKGVDVLREQNGNKVGEIEFDGSKQVLVDRYFVRLGSYDLTRRLLLATSMARRR